MLTCGKHILKLLKLVVAGTNLHIRYGVNCLIRFLWNGIRQ